MSLKACIYDLDGVITDTAKYHFESWKWVGEQLGYELTEKQNGKLKGVGRKESMDRIIKWANVRISEAEKQNLLVEKNSLYLTFIDGMGPEEVFEGFKTFNQQLRNSGVKVAVGSSSKNAIRIIDKLDLVLDFDAIVDGGMVTRSKPDPEIFRLAAEKLRIEPAECMVIEDSQAGIDAARAAGMKVIAFGPDKSLKNAETRIDSWVSSPVPGLIQMFQN